MKSGIYTITCLIDNKIYLGYTSNFIKRKHKHFYELKNNIHKNEHLQNAVNKYGIENFEFEILEEYDNIGFILPSMEHYWANLLNVHNKNYGYNIKLTHPTNKVEHSLETREKISRNNKGKCYGKRGFKHSKETIDKLKELKRLRPIHKGWKWSEEAKKNLSEKNKGGKGWTGRKHSEETKQKLSNIKKGIKFTEEHIKNIRASSIERGKKHRIPIVGFDKDLNKIGEWDSTIMASKELNLKTNLISQVLNKRMTHHKGYAFIYKSDFEKGILPEKPVFYKNKRKVIQTDDENNILNIFNSVREAAKYIKTHETHLGTCCKQHKKFKGYLWKYKEN